MRQRELTEDTLFEGGLLCHQHRNGYRFSVDAVLLAHFVSPERGAHILDLGAGCGIVSLLLAYRHPSVMLSAVEIQKSLFALCRQNVLANGFEKRIAVLHGDMCRLASLFPAESFDWAVSNPPYRKLASGRRNPGREQNLARHEVKASLQEVLAAASYAVKNRGRVALVYPATRLAALLAAFRFHGLEPKRLQPVYSYPGGPAKLVLVESVKNGGEELKILEPFYIYREQGDRGYSAAMLELYRPSAPPIPE